MKKATRKHTKLHNQRLILRTIYQQDDMSRADLARATKLTKTTVSSIVSDLIADKLIEETGRRPSKGGKPAMSLAIVANSRHLIGLDLANSEFRGGVIDLRGRFLHRAHVPLADSNGRLALEKVYELTDNLMAKVTSPLLGIGIGSPGLMDARTGIVRHAVNLDWEDLPLRDLLQARFGVPVYLVNDSHAAALGEYTFGPDRGTANLIVIKVGRGTGAGIVLNGRLHYGDSSGAGEIGHVRVVSDGALCRCGHTGCLETIASSRAINKKAQAIYTQNAASALHRYAQTVEEVNTKCVVRAFEDGDPAIVQVITEVGRYLGIAIANLVGALNIENIIIGGSVAQFGEPLLDVIREQMQTSAMAALVEASDVHLSELGQDIVVLGAASVLLSHELGIV